jgi:hypothetical protein
MSLPRAVGVPWRNHLHWRSWNGSLNARHEAELSGADDRQSSVRGCRRQLASSRGCDACMATADRVLGTFCRIYLTV